MNIKECREVLKRHLLFRIKMKFDLGKSIFVKWVAEHFYSYCTRVNLSSTS